MHVALPHHYTDSKVLLTYVNILTCSILVCFHQESQMFVCCLIRTATSTTNLHKIVSDLHTATTLEKLLTVLYTPLKLQNYVCHFTFRNKHWHSTNLLIFPIETKIIYSLIKYYDKGGSKYYIFYEILTARYVLHYV